MSLMSVTSVSPEDSWHPNGRQILRQFGRACVTGVAPISTGLPPGPMRRERGDTSCALCHDATLSTALAAGTDQVAIDRLQRGIDESPKARGMDGVLRDYVKPTAQAFRGTYQAGSATPSRPCSGLIQGRAHAAYSSKHGRCFDLWAIDIGRSSPIPAKLRSYRPVADWTLFQARAIATSFRAKSRFAGLIP